MDENNSSPGGTSTTATVVLVAPSPLGKTVCARPHLMRLAAEKFFSWWV